MAGVFLVVLSQRGVLDPFQGFGLRLLSPFSSAIDGLAEAISGNAGAPQSELEAEIERLRAEIAALQIQAGRVAELEDQLGFRTANSELDLQGARVLQARTDNFQELITISRGTDDGVQEGMVVLSPNGSLVGWVTDARDDSSFVRLITDPKARVDVSIPNAEVTTVASSIGSDELALDLVPKGTNVREGDPVVTDGLTGRFPDGILLGVVKSVSETDELFLRIIVDISAPLGGLDTVMVLMNFEPRSLEDLGG